MLTTWQIVLAVAQLAPLVLKLIRDAETTFGPGLGKAKKAQVMAVVDSAPPDVKEQVGRMIDSVVAIQKKAGVHAVLNAANPKTPGGVTK